MNILAIETSCDETAASIVDINQNNITVKSSVISSQVHLHAQWGGVVPNLAAREHTKNMIPVLTETFTTAHAQKDNIDLIAVTHGPGLIPALLSGVSTAKSLAYIWRKPLIGIHHIEGHIYANWIENSRQIAFPVLALVVSGGHTQLVLMHDHCTYEIIGQTQDDAVGEAFDKVARLLALGYPGGPIISERAQKFEDSGQKNDITLPRPMENSGDYNFSFSGIKTAVLYLVNEYRKKAELKNNDHLPQDFIDATAHAFQRSVVEVLTKKTLKAAKQYNIKTIVLAGGVSANMQLRENLKKQINKQFPDVFFSTPPIAYCLDNAAMIAVAAYYRYKTLSKNDIVKLFDGWKSVNAKANRPLNILTK